MGSQFWWFYDVIAAAIILVSIFLSGKKGVLRGTVAAIGCMIALALAAGVSSGVSESLYSNTMRSANIRKISNVIRSDTFINKYSAYLESLGYNIHPSEEKLDRIFSSEKGDIDESLCYYINNINGRRILDDDAALKAVHEGYAVVISEIVSQSLNKYAAEVTANEIRSDPSGMQELIPMIHDKEDKTPPAKFITDNYTAQAYITIYKLATFAIVFAAALLLTLFLSYSTVSKSEPSRTSEYLIGGFTGIFTGVILVFIAAVITRLWAVLGSNEMLFFNNEVIDNSLIFKYFYKFASML